MIKCKCKCKWFRQYKNPGQDVSRINGTYGHHSGTGGCVVCLRNRLASRTRRLIHSSLFTQRRVCVAFLNPGERELWVSWQKRGGVIKLSLRRHCRGRDRFDETTGRLGRIMKSARTLQTYSEGGPVPAILPFARLRRSLCILSRKTETEH